MAAQPSIFAGVPDEIRKLITAKMDDAPTRRRAREAFKHIQLSIDHYLFKVPTHDLKMEEWYEKNSRGFEIFTKTWVPQSCSPKGLICFCHGYGDTCTFFSEGTARKLASAGYAVCAMDLPGFGLSDGLHGYIPSFENLVDDVIENYSKVREKPEFRTLPTFLFGQSMGGAVALKVHLKQPNAWNGAVLLAPMCKIADDMYPPVILTKLLITLSKALPKSKLVPELNLADKAFRVRKELAAYNVIAYKDKPRLRTAVELLHTTDEIERRLQEVSFPLLILHGEADMVTDPSVSRALYEKASSKDKKFNLYKDSYHALLEGEPDEVISRVFDDIISWLDDHSLKIDSAKEAASVTSKVHRHSLMHTHHRKIGLDMTTTLSPQITAAVRHNWSFLGGLKITVRPKVEKCILTRKCSGVCHSWMSNSQIASSVFTLGTAAVLPFYTLMLAAPKAELTKKAMRSSLPYVALGLLYTYLLWLSWTPDTIRLMFASKYWLPELQGIAKMFANEMTLASAWIHLLVVDLFAARQVYQDGLENGIETRHSVSLCLLFCPVGIISHAITKGMTKNAANTKRNDGHV